MWSCAQDHLCSLAKTLKAVLLAALSGRILYYTVSKFHSNLTKSTFG